MLGVDAPESRLVALRTELGLDKPIIIRYFKYIQGVLQGDFGQSYLYKLPVMEVLYDKILVTLTISILAFIIVIVTSFLLSIYIVKNRNTIFDYLLTVLNQLNMSNPIIFLGILITYIFGIVFRFSLGKFVSFEPKSSLHFLDILYFLQLQWLCQSQL